jgi:hypothetical protein
VDADAGRSLMVDAATLQVALLFANISPPEFKRHLDISTTDLPSASDIDLLVLKGVWSQADAAQRATLLTFARSALSETGVLVVDYATTPGAALPATLQRIGFDMAQKANDLGSLFFKTNPAAAPTLDAMRGRNVETAVRVTSFAEMAHAMSEVGLTFAASARLIDAVPAMNFAREAFQLLQQENDPIIREIKKDLMLNRGLRCDIFMKKIEQLTPQHAAERIAAIKFKTTLPLEKIEKLAVLTAYAESKPTPQARRLFEVLSKSPASALELAERRVMGCENVWKNVESVLVLMAMDAIIPERIG